MSEDLTAQPRTAATLPTIALVFFIFALAWWVVSDGQMSAWLIGVPTVTAATWVVIRMRRDPLRRVSIAGALKFVPFFVHHSLRGGIDVALRVMHPKIAIDPGFVIWPTQLAPGAPRMLFGYCVNLLPGTLAADLENDKFTIHVLNQTPAVRAELARLEHYIAGIFPGAGPPR